MKTFWTRWPPEPPSILHLLTVSKEHICTIFPLQLQCIQLTQRPAPPTPKANRIQIWVLHFTYPFHPWSTEVPPENKGLFVVRDFLVQEDSMLHLSQLPVRQLPASGCGIRTSFSHNCQTMKLLLTGEKKQVREVSLQTYSNNKRREVNLAEKTTVGFHQKRVSNLFTQQLALPQNTPEMGFTKSKVLKILQIFLRVRWDRTDKKQRRWTLPEMNERIKEKKMGWPHNEPPLPWPGQKDSWPVTFI